MGIVSGLWLDQIKVLNNKGVVEEGNVRQQGLEVGGQCGGQVTIESVSPM